MNAEQGFRTDYLGQLLDVYYPRHFFAVFRSHELYSVEPFIGLLRPPVLDLGCGDGSIPKVLFGRPLEYGMDLSEPAVRAAKEKGAHEITLVGEAHAIPLASNHLGGVFSNCTLEHIPDMPALLSEIARVLKTGAFFVSTCLSPFYYTMNPIFRFLDRSSFRWLRSRMIAEENRLHNHVSIYEADEYRQMLEQCGMVLDRHTYYAPRPITEFCSKWDTASKYMIPFPVGLRHSGLLIKYLQLRYTTLSNKAKTVYKWHQAFSTLCYSRAGPGRVGAGQIIVARKI